MNSPFCKFTLPLNVAPEALNPALKLVIVLNVLLPVKVCVPSSPANSVVNDGKDASVVVTTLDGKTIDASSPEVAS